MPYGLGFWAAAGSGGGASAQSYELISTQILGSDAASVTFSSIPSTYKHLQLRASSRGAGAGGTTQLLIRLNSDTGANYSWHRLYAEDTTPSTSSNNGVSQTSMRIGSTMLAGMAVNSFAPAITDILDYGSSKNKTIKSFAGKPLVAREVGLISGNWINTSAVNSIILLVTAGNIATGSRFSLYGIKG